MIDKLYKYINFESGLKILENKTLWFSKPEKLNDPYDCYKNLIRITPSKKGIEDYINRNYPKYRLQEKVRKKNYFIKNQGILIDNIKQGIREREINLGITCFSRTYLNILMWSHYSNNHTGICIGFKFDFDNTDFFIYPVNYTDEFPNTDYFCFPENALLDWVLTKSKAWEYEQEVRAVSFNRNGINKIDFNVITEIYLGSKIDIENREVILSIAENTDINVFQIEMEDSSFNLKAQPLTWLQT
ncbi:MAG: DUF2971 domain-containing protein [Bacteroidales bacterium]|nr:DUF2971 domain-containing protein [Bacteroidales bacterium]